MKRSVLLASVTAVLLSVGLFVYGVYQSWAAEDFTGCNIEITVPKPRVKLGEPLEVHARITNRAWHPRILSLHEALQKSLMVALRENNKPVGYDPTVTFKEAPDALNREWLWPNDQLEVPLKLTFGLDKYGRCRAEFYGMRSGPMTQLDKLKVSVVGLPFSATRARTEKLLSNTVAIEVTR